MAITEGKFQDVLSEFAATTDFIKEVATNFQKDLQIGLRDPKSSCGTSYRQRNGRIFGVGFRRYKCARFENQT